MEKLRRLLLFFRLVAYIAKAYGIDSVRRKFATPFIPTPTASTPFSEVKNVVVIGASFAGYNAARLLASSLPPGFRLVVVEPRSHFHFTWVFPRFCIVPGHNMKAFIPYGAYLPKHRDGVVTWMRGRAVELTSNSVTIQMVGDGAEKEMEVLPYEFLVIATGSMPTDQDGQEDTGGLPSRLVDDDRAIGTKRMERLQKRIANAKRLVVVGGGAAGVELATDAASYHNIKEIPERKVVLVHSRDALMHRFGPRLQAAALHGCHELAVDVILNDRVASNVADGVVTLKSGRKLECDCLIDCTGQRPASSLVMTLSPQAITPSGHIHVKPTLQVADVNLPNIYACGDVADADSQTPNGRSAAMQARVVADNIIAAARGRPSTYTFKPHWADACIKLTLGLEDSVVHFGDSQTELLFHPKDKDPALGVDRAWKVMGATPFEDSTGGETTS